MFTPATFRIFLFQIRKLSINSNLNLHFVAPQYPNQVFVLMGFGVGGRKRDKREFHTLAEASNPYFTFTEFLIPSSWEQRDGALDDGQHD